MDLCCKDILLSMQARVRGTLTNMPVAPHTVWSEERTARLCEFAAAGLSARAIAQELGVTRNAVIGKAYREGGLLAKQDNRTPEQRRHDRLVRRRAQQRARMAILRATPGYHRVRKALPVAPPSRQLPLIDLGIDMCHWPVSDDTPHCFCGNFTDGHIYCPFHHMLGIDKNQGRRAPRVYVF